MGNTAFEKTDLRKDAANLFEMVDAHRRHAYPQINPKPDAVPAAA